MANYSAYIPAAGSTTYPTQISNFITISEGMDTEIENGRDGLANLLANFNTKLPLAGGTLTGALTISTGSLTISTGGILIGASSVPVKDGALSNGVVVTGDSSGRVSTTSGIVATNIATLSGTQTLTGNKTFSGTNILSSNTTATTQSAGDNSTKLATTAYVDEAAPNFKGCLVTFSSDFTLATSTNDELTFNTEAYDTDSIHDNATNNTRLTVPTGITRIKLKAFVEWEANSNTSGTRITQILRNGTTIWTGTVIEHENNPPSLKAVYHNLITPVITVIATDYFEIRIWQDSGVNFTINSTTTWFAMEIIE